MCIAEGVDVDASAALLTRDVQVIDMVWWHKLKSNCKSVTHSGDDRTGEGTGDDETITVDIPAIPLDVHHILFTVCIYSEGYTFNDVCLSSLSLNAHASGATGDKCVC